MRSSSSLHLRAGLGVREAALDEQKHDPAHLGSVGAYDAMYGTAQQREPDAEIDVAHERDRGGRRERVLDEHHLPAAITYEDVPAVDVVDRVILVVGTGTQQVELVDLADTQAKNVARVDL